MTMAGRILVVDDNRDAANTLARLLSVLGHEARVAYGGDEALDIATGFPFDMAFIDLGMPNLNGYETCARLRQNRMSGDVVMVALTGWSQEQDKQLALKSGFDVHVAKPMSEQRLNELLALLVPKVSPAKNQREESPRFRS